MLNRNGYFNYEGIYMMQINDEGIYFRQNDNKGFEFSKEARDDGKGKWYRVAAYRTTLTPYEKMLADYLFDMKHSETAVCPVEDGAMKGFAYFAYNYNPETGKVLPLYITDSREVVDTRKSIDTEKTSDGYVFAYQRISLDEPFDGTYDVYNAIDDLLYRVS